MDRLKAQFCFNIGEDPLTRSLIGLTISNLQQLQRGTENLIGLPSWLWCPLSHRTHDKKNHNTNSFAPLIVALLTALRFILSVKGRLVIQNARFQWKKSSCSHFFTARMQTRKLAPEEMMLCALETAAAVAVSQPGYTEARRATEIVAASASAHASSLSPSLLLVTQPPRTQRSRFIAVTGQGQESKFCPLADLIFLQSSLQHSILKEMTNTLFETWQLRAESISVTRWRSIILFTHVQVTSHSLRASETKSRHLATL